MPPTTEEKRVIEQKMSTLASRVAALTAKKADPALLADVDIYRKAAEYILRFPEEFATKAFTAEHDRGARYAAWRAPTSSKSGAPSWPTRKGHVVRAYVSKIDGSVQPYGLTIPDSYDGTKPVRLDVWQHGTNRALNEVAFIIQQESDRPIPPDQDYIQVEPLGRTNVAYRWAGEVDLFETLASVQQRYKIDPKRIVLRGFSMGGASTWHLGLHHPGRWAAIEAGAGFTETHRYADRETCRPIQEAMLHYYDAVDYSLNAFNTPTRRLRRRDRRAAAGVGEHPRAVDEGGLPLSARTDRIRWVTHRPARAVPDRTEDAALLAAGQHAPNRTRSSTRCCETRRRCCRRHLRFVTYTTRFNSVLLADRRWAG